MENKTKIQCSVCKRFFKDDFCDMDGNFKILQDIENNPNKRCVECEDKFHRGIVNNSDGIFYCPKCNIRTDDKTYQTKCVFCKGDLVRIGKQ